MLNHPTDHLPRDVDFVDWGLEWLRYDVQRQSLEIALDGPALTDWRLEARFGHVVYLRIYTRWEVYRWEEWGSDESVEYLGEEPTLAEVQRHVDSYWGGLRLQMALGAGGDVSTKVIAPSDVRLRAFVLVSHSVTLQWLCADVEVQAKINPSPPPPSADDGA